MRWAEPPAVFAWAALAGAGAGGVAVGALIDSPPVRPWLVVTLFVVGAVLAAGVVLVCRRCGPAPLPLPGAVAVAMHPPTDRERGGLDRVERMLAKALSDGGRFEDALGPRLRVLTEHRLRREHGVDFRHDPQRARLLLGDGLWRLMTTRITRAPSRRELTTWLHDIGQL